MQTIHEPQREKRSHFAKMQEGARKNVERAFGVLQSRWRIVKNPCRQWELDTITNIMIACVIVHNMIIEDKQGHNLEQLFQENENLLPQHQDLIFHELREAIIEPENIPVHYALRNDLMDHFWQKRREERF
jgi:hypothetical protein